MQPILEIWREACRHIDLNESVSRMTMLVNQRFDVDLVIVRRFDEEQQIVETIAVGQKGGVPVPRSARSESNPDEIKQLVRWCRTGKILRFNHRGMTELYRRMVPENVTGAFMVGPLVTESNLTGVLLMVRRSGEPFEEEDEEHFRLIVEPFAVALERHYRFHELRRLKEALEADKRALLSRLHRKELLDEIVGAEGSLKSVMASVEQVAPTHVPVLILGETGTGKEVIARAIHSRSSRTDGPIVRVNCGAIPPELVDSELFGHEKGSFTGAVNSRKGWFERADGGTLFLDEVGELPPAAQVRLLRIIQDGTFERVGGHQTLSVDVRIVAATHRDMESMIREGTFREDLWYRISVFPIYLPPLRARRADIPDLVGYFARNAGLRFGDAPLIPSAGDMEILTRYPWPGNVRELAAVIERAAILGGGHRLDITGAMGTKLHALEERLFEPGVERMTGDRSLDQAMKQHIEEILRKTSGRIEGPHGAASQLGINPNTLRARMRKLDIDWRNFRSVN